MKKSGIFIGLVIMGMQLLSGQKFPEKGMPPIKDYTPDEYTQAGKVWSIQSAENGLVYFATDKGLLEFDGQHWRRHSGSRGFTRSLLVVHDSLIYAGADKDFGAWHREGFQRYAYESLYPFRETAKGLNEEFWGVYQLKEEIVFVSFDNLYIRKEGQLTKLAAPSRFSNSFQLDSVLYLPDEEQGLFQFDGLSLTHVFAYPGNEPWTIVGVDQTEDGLLVITRDRGLFVFHDGALRPLQQEVNDLLKQDQVFSFTVIEDSHYAFGTILNGVYITDREGRIIQHINKQKGLLNNTVLSLHYSPQGSLWLGMDYGISVLRLSSDVAYILDQQGEFGTGHTALLQGKDFFLGTNQGLYYSSWEALKNNVSGISFSLVRGSAGQVWWLENIDGTIWCGHDRGLFTVSRQGLTPIYTNEGVLAITPLGEQHLVAGTYNGLSLFRRDGGRWSFEGKLNPVQGACSQVIADGDSLLWINIPNFGIIKATLNDQYRIAKQRIYLTSVFEGENPWLLTENQPGFLTTTRYGYTYEALLDSFLRVDTHSAPTAVENPLPVFPVGLPLNDTFDFFPVYNGFALRNRTSHPTSGQDSPILFRNLAAFNNDTTISYQESASIPYQLNNVRIEFLTPHQEETTYRFRLANFEDTWSAWSPQSSCDYLHLPEGKYELLVEAKSAAGVTRSPPLSFTILPPWYRRWYAYLGATIMLLGLYLLQRLRNQRKLDRLEAEMKVREQKALEKQAEAYQQEKMVQNQQRLEAEIADLRKRLRAKTIELAKKGKENDDKNRLLQTLKDKIASIEHRSSETNRRWAEMTRLLDNKVSPEDHTFDMQLDELNQEFLRRMKAAFPALTAYDLRLATYLRMGLSSREIAELLHVLPSSVNVSRSRLRKKLSLEAEQDLYEFLMEV